MDQGKTTFIYGLIDPVSRQLRYVGKTVLDPRCRLRTHLWGARTSARKRHLFAWLAGLQAAGARPDIFVIEEVVPGGDWEEAEQFWIAYFRFIGANLCNLTTGGEGAPGKKLSAEHIERLRSRRGPLSPLFGRPVLPHVHAALKAGQRRMLDDPGARAAWRSKQLAGFTDEILAAATERLAAVRRDPERLAKREEKRIAACQTVQHREGVSRQSKELWSSKRNEIIAAQNIGKQTAEFKRKQSEARKALWRDPNSPYWKSFLTVEQREEIRRHLRDGMTGAAAARKFGLSESRISQIKHGA